MEGRREGSETSSEQSSLRSASRVSGWREARTRSEQEFGMARPKEVEEVLLQRQAHMARIKKEMRKLEKLDRWLMRSGRGEVVGSVSELSIQTTVSTVATDSHVSRVSRKERRREAAKENLVPTVIRQQGPPAESLEFGQNFPSEMEEVSRIESRTRTVTNTTAITLQSVHIQTETVDTSAESMARVRRAERRAGTRARTLWWLGRPSPMRASRWTAGCMRRLLEGSSSGSSSWCSC